MDDQPYGTAEADARLHAAIEAMRDLFDPYTWGNIKLTVEEALVPLQDEDGQALPAVLGHGTASGEAGDGRATRAAEAALADLRDQLAALRMSQAERG